MARMPAAEVDVDLPLVHRLLTDQHPDLADLPMEVVANGWDNVMLRLGEELVARLPRRQAAAALVEHEQLVLPRLADRLPVAVPEPVRVGRATDYYPWSWTVARWLPGAPAAAQLPSERDQWAGELAEFLVALHTPAEADAPANPVRGVPLADRAEAIRARFDAGTFAGARELRELFEESASAPVHSGPPLWLHGDLHPLNLLAAGDRLTAVIDFGDTTSGDPATDLGTAWLTFTAAGRSVFVDRYTAGTGADAATWSRARAWGASFAGVLLASSDDHPELAAIGRHARAELLTEGEAPPSGP
ncbi:aminoglycoside phosphotransferase family protein [Ruania zhangjianzhongii]|uniref:aminoglycoside phosphotransferase family protein n=1 Tax=Ruania zhangjianzhongii TaxID=2603206 RepID=UPI001F274C33|nr:aminoglycoside phosphotransferase family protein [Ruania zhangjianzhongii]